MTKLRRGEWDPWIEGVIIGTNEHEGSVFAMGMGVRLYFLPSFFSHLTPPRRTQASTPEGFNAFVSKSFPPSTHSALISHYSPPTTDSGSEAVVDHRTSPTSRLLADLLFTQPAYRLAKTLSSRKEAKSGKESKVWLYRVRTEVERISNSVAKLGAM
ncbi:hypothetical protein P7C70_g8870, partial [Phenoliferia sp. Uapishka_3]